MPRQTRTRISAFGIHCGDRRRARPEWRLSRRSGRVSHSAAPPPGDSRTSSATPCQTNSMASVTTMSGTRVMTIRRPLIAPRTRPSSEHEGDDQDRELLAGAAHQDRGGDAGQRHHRGDREVDAAGDDHDGLGGDRERVGQDGADQRADAARAVVGLNGPGADKQDREQHEQAEDPALAVERTASCAAPASRGRPCAARIRERFVGALERQGVDDAAAENDDRAIADQPDLLKLRRVEQHRNALGGQLAQQRIDLALGAGCRCRASGRSTASCGSRPRSSGRWSPSAGCRRKASAPRAARACRSAAARSRRRRGRSRAAC